MPVRTLLIAGVALPLIAGALYFQQADSQKDSQPMPGHGEQPEHTNRLIHATSPYLLQHAHNPVDWYEWGPEALERAKRENKPLFVSIGYSACHWCHVMAHESFEDEEIAAVMNEHFVCIKVDREERPDIDDIYMQATLIMNNGQGGWPMSVWMTPDLKPFLAGTYFPPRAKWGKPGFLELCRKVGEFWDSKHEAILADADRLAEVVDQSLSGKATASGPALDLQLIDRVVPQFAGAFDKIRGGVSGGGTNKFPPSMALDLFLRYIQRHDADDQQSVELRAIAELTLDRMARGGIYDQLAGGIHRYSTDVEWLVPHFEKMLYDQALVSRIYVDAWQMTRKPLYKRIATEIFDYVLADLQTEAGGIRSTRDADSEGEEGKYYVWTKPEIVEALGKPDAELLCSYYDVSDAGNWSDPHDPGTPKNILHVPRELEAVAKLNNVSAERLEAALQRGRAKLLEIRSKRVPPGLDDKILVEWNGLMIASLARGGAAFGEPKYVSAAKRAANFILEHQYEDGRLIRSYRDGRKLETAFLTDYACLIEALIELYEATFEKRWLETAVELNDAAIEHFWDEKLGGFFFTPDDHERLITRAKDIRDSATPSGNSVQLMNLLRLSAMLGDRKLREMAERTMQALAGAVTQMIGASDRFLTAVEFARVGPVELAIVGDPQDAATQALLRTVREQYLPNRVIMLANPSDATAAATSPLLANRPLVDGQPTAYVCRNYVCKLPVTTPKELRAQLTSR